MASVTTPQFLFPTLQPQERKKDSTPKAKRIENPLLNRSAALHNTGVAANTSVFGTGSAFQTTAFTFGNAASRAPLHSIQNTISDGSRNSSVVKPADASARTRTSTQVEKEEDDFFFGAPPPKASLSMMGYMNQRQQQKSQQPQSANPNTNVGVGVSVSTPTASAFPTISSGSNTAFSTTTPTATTTTTMKQTFGTQPPRASTANPSASSAEAFSTLQPAYVDDNRWVLVHGYTNQDQYEEILALCHTLGCVTDSRGATTSNWVAVQFADPLAAQKAICHNSHRLPSGIFIGVTQLTPQLHRSIHASEFAVGRVDRAPAAKPFFTDVYDRDAIIHPKMDFLDDRDILLHCEDDPAQEAATSVCDRVMAWCKQWVQPTKAKGE